jgi:hypothetical protein
MKQIFDHPWLGSLPICFILSLNRSVKLGTQESWS